MCAKNVGFFSLNSPGEFLYVSLEVFLKSF